MTNEPEAPQDDLVERFQNLSWEAAGEPVKWKDIRSAFVREAIAALSAVPTQEELSDEQIDAAICAWMNGFDAGQSANAFRQRMRAAFKAAVPKREA